MGCLRIVPLHPILSASLVIILPFALGLLSAQAQAPSLLNKMRALDVPGATVPAHHISSLRIPVAQGLRSEVLHLDQSLVRPRCVTLGISFQVVRVHHDRVSHFTRSRVFSSQGILETQKAFGQTIFARDGHGRTTPHHGDYSLLFPTLDGRPLVARTREQLY
jgi:hypothetical protein